MGLVEEVGAARAELARAADDLQRRRDGLDKLRSAGTLTQAGLDLPQLEARVGAARTRLEQVERDVLDRARAILEERDPDYARQIAESKLEASVEKWVLIGAADRLSA